MLVPPGFCPYCRAIAMSGLCWIGSTQMSVAQTFQSQTRQVENAQQTGGGAASDNQTAPEATLEAPDRSELEDLLALDISQLGNTQVVVEGFCEPAPHRGH